jgi:hypothetical protein
MRRGYSRFDKWWSGKGMGIDCSHLNETRKERTWYGFPYYNRLD